MAPIGEAYFPPLDRCFSGDDPLLSWETTYIALSQPNGDTESRTLKRHLTDPQTIDLLVGIFTPYKAPTAQTKSTFETKTSAINVTPTRHASFDIKQIQEDSLWLSKKTNIDEVAALRIAVLEWQRKSATQLLQGELLEGSLKPLELSVSVNRAATLLARSAWRGTEAPKPHDATTARHLRLLEIYLLERRYLLKTSEYILSRLICARNLGVGRIRAQNEDDNLEWLNRIGEAIVSNWKVEDADSGKGNTKGLVANAADALRSRLEELIGGCRWTDSEDVPDDIEIAWGHNQLVEMVHILQIVMSLLEVPKGVLASGPILAWFRLMNEVGFFEGLRLPIEALHGMYDLPLQSLAVLVSLALLDISSTLELLAHISAAGVPSADPTDRSPYALSAPTVSEINDLLINLATLRVASPVTLAWSIITQSARELALATRESKETRQSLRAADRYGAADSSDTDGGERYSLRSVSSLRRRESTGSDTSLQSLLVEDIFDATTLTAVDGDPIAYLAMNAIQDNNFFDIVSAIACDYCTPFGFEHDGRPGQKMRNVLLELVRSCVDFIQYQPALIHTIMAALTGSERFWDLLDRPVIMHEDQPSNIFIRDQELRQRILLMATSRFPYESIPFLQFCRALSFQYTSSDGSTSPPWASLEELDTFTCRLPLGFEMTCPIREEEEGDFIKLTDNLSVVVGSEETDLFARVDQVEKPSRSFPRINPSITRIIIPAGTTGVVQSETKPFVVGWNHQYPGLAYMGKVLQRASITSSSVGSASAVISTAVVAETISLMSVLLASALKTPGADRDPSLPLESAQSILGQASDGLDRNQDVVSVISEIFDNELHSPQQASQEDASMDVLIQCIQFVNVLLLLMPDRVWPFLGRSCLLGIGQEESQMSCVIAQEMVLGRYEFLLGCIRLYEALIDDAVSHAISRRAPGKAMARFGSVDSLASGVSQITMQNVLLSLSRSMIDVLESTVSWRFLDPADRMELNQRICSGFGKTLIYCYGVDDNAEISEKLTSALAMAANYIVEAFLSTSNNDFIVKPLLNIFTTAIQTSVTTLPTYKEQYQIKQTVAALDLATTLLGVNTTLHRPPSYLEGELFKITPILAKVYTAHQNFRLPVVKLFDSLLCSAAIGDRRPPSLLGHLGQEGSNCFLEVLGQLDKPLNDDALSVAIWSLLSAVVSKRQQWFAMYVLTGNTPRETLKDRKWQSASTNPSQTEPILNIALDSLSSIDKLEPPRALGMLEFVATSADYWPLVFTIMDQHPRFLKAISEYVASVKFVNDAPRGKSSASSHKYDTTQMASYVAKILAMYTHYTHQLGNQKFARALIPHLNYLMKNAISGPMYNNSLHGNLCVNFQEKFLGCSLTDFKRTELRRAVLGESFFYDTDFASKVLSHNPAWSGRKGQGFAEEFRRANVNLSIVEAQVNMFHSWKSLLVELSGPLSSEPKFQKIMALAVTDCLQANTEKYLPQAVFGRLSSSRADLAFTLLQRLAEVKSREAEFKEILPIAWASLRTYGTNLEITLGGEDAEYYRMLLKILYLALQAHTSDAVSGDHSSTSANGSLAKPLSPSSKSTLQTIFEILSVIIAQGFRSLTILLHSSPNSVYSSDFSLLTAILRSCLRVPNLDRSSSHLLTTFSDSQTARCAATLLSWSDQLAASASGEPIFGELSIAFLVELSSDTALAESLAVDGVLDQVLSTNVIRVVQTRAFGPFDSPRGMYAIWAKGLLPLLLNLLSAIGPPMAAEVAASLNSFPHQLVHASSAFAANARSTNASHGNLTLSMATEAHDLALIVSILNGIREAGASVAVFAGDIEEVKWDAVQVKEDLEGWLQDRGSLRAKIMATNKREEAWVRRKPSSQGKGAENMLEEKVVDELSHVVGILVGNGEA